MSADQSAGQSAADRLELTSYTRRDDGGTKASYLDPNDRTKSLVEIWIPFSGEDKDENGKSYLKRTSTLPAKINLIRGDDTDGASARERHQSEPQYAPSNEDSEYQNDTLTGNGGLAAVSSDPLYSTLRSQSSWKSAPHSITSLGTTMATPYDHYTLTEEERREKKKRRWPLILCCLVLVILSILAVVLAVLLTTVLDPKNPEFTAAAIVQNPNNNASTSTREPVIVDPATTTPMPTDASTTYSPTTRTTTRPPDVDGGWGAWQSWSSCNQPCDGGDRTRLRLCNNPEPQNGGKPCSGDKEITQRCNTQPCPDGAISGGWGNWGGWSRCTRTCGSGHQVKRRLCNNPAPQNGGKNCVGDAAFGRDCSTRLCPLYNVEGTVSDATNNNPIKEASVTLAGHTTQSNDQGKFSLSNIPGGTHTLVASASGYAINSRRVKVQRSIPTGAADIVLSPIITNKGGFRVVLTWGNDPIDLDLYVLTPYGCKVYYNNHQCPGSGDSNFLGELDVDDTDGYGPETITMRDPYCGDTYVVYVGIYSLVADPKGSFNGSQARVQLFNSTTLVETVAVPYTGYNPLWQFWHVLNITPRRKNLVQYTLVNRVRSTPPAQSAASQLADRDRVCKTETHSSDSDSSDSDSD